MLSELIKATESAEDRDHLLNCLIQAPADSRAKMAACGMCLGALNSWLLELIAYGQTGSTAELTIKVGLMPPACPISYQHCRPHLFLPAFPPPFPPT